MIAIIDYGMGNLASVQKALNFLNIPNVITNDASIIRSSDSIILPGVGSFTQGMKNLTEAGLTELLTEEVVAKKKKFLGICLGMQLIATTGSEPVITKGLGWINGEVVKIQSPNLRIPHLGWNETDIVNDTFFKDIPDKNFYFIHSYHFIVNCKKNIAATVHYGTDLVAAIFKDNIFAVQFHPEKSQGAGLTVLKNYFSS